MTSNIKKNIEEANKKALDLMLSSETYWVGIKPVIKAVPGIKKNTILHAGPPIKWENMCKLQRKGIIGGILHEGMATSEDEALNMIKKNKIEILSANDLGVVGAGVGIVSPSMVVNICLDKNTGEKGYCIPFEGRVGLGAWGVYNKKVEKNLQIIEKVLAPSVDKILEKNGGINIKRIIYQGMQMNDETHTRQVAEGLILASEIIPLLVKSDLDKDLLIQCVDIFIKTERWFHPLGMASAMAILNGIRNIKYSTVVTAMCGNGVEYGIKISSLGDRWFTASAPMIQGKYFSTRWGPEDTIPWIGDSCLVETVGLGGFAAAAAPAVVRLRGGTIDDAIQQTEEMKDICIGINNNYPIPLLEFSGPPIGIDIRKVVQTGITPVSHGGIISKDGGQLGAGIARLPMKLFEDALLAFVEKYEIT
jgi:hypothetical protein